MLMCQRPFSNLGHERLVGPHLLIFLILHRLMRYARFGTYGIAPAYNAGLDLEMPGTNKWRSLDLVNRSLVARKINIRTVKQRARKVLDLVQKCAAGAPEVRRRF